MVLLLGKIFLKLINREWRCEMIKNLPVYSAVNLGDKYLVQLEYHQEYIINGNIIKGSINGGQIIVSDIKDIKLHIKPYQRIINYKNDDGTTLSEDEFDDILSKYMYYYNSEDEDFVFDDDIDMHIQYLKDKKYKDSFTPVFTSEKSYSKSIEFKVIGSLVDTGSKYIETAINYGNINYFGGSGIYKVFIGMIAKDTFDLLYKDHSDVLSYGVNDKDTIEYVTYKTDYIFLKNKPNYLKKDAVKVVNSLEDAKNIEASIRAEVTNIINSFLYPQEVTETDVRVIKDKLTNVVSLLTISKSHTLVQTKFKIDKAVTEINELIKLLG